MNYNLRRQAAVKISRLGVSRMKCLVHCNKWLSSIIANICVSVCASSKGWVSAEGRISCAVVLFHCELMMLTLM